MSSRSMRTAWTALLLLLAAALALGPGCSSEMSPESAKQQLAAMKAEGRLDDVSETNFIYCASMDDLVAVKLYLASGLSPNVKNRYGNMPLHAVINHNTSSPWSGKNPEVMKLLLEKGADPNAPDGEGVTPLAMATRNNWPKVIELLKAHGAK